MKRQINYSYLLVSLFFTGSSLADPLDGVSSWGYQLQNVSPVEVAQAPFNLFVIDYSKDGSNTERFTAEDLTQMKSSGKKIVSYLSVGEAEDYRYYFKSNWIRRDKKAICKIKLSSEAPVWLDQPNRNWCGNFKTRFWYSEWQKIIFGVRKSKTKSYLDRIIDAGFDGVYLDIIDGYEYWQRKKGSERRRQAAKDMANFVIRLSRYAKVKRNNPNFIVIPQNGAGILTQLDLKTRTSYLNAIDGIGSEDTFYFGNEPENNNLKPQLTVLNQLKRYLSAGKKVFSIDYLTTDTKVTDFFSRACSEGFIPQVSTRNLDSFNGLVLGPCQ